MHSDMISLIRQVHLRFAKFFARKCATERISLPQYMLLMSLLEEGDQKMNSLARLLKTSTPSVTNLVDKLEAAGYVRRLPHPGDRRAHIIKLTAKGREFVDRFRKESLSILSDTLAELSPAETAVMKRFYGILIRKLDEALAAPR